MDKEGKSIEEVVSYKGEKKSVGWIYEGKCIDIKKKEPNCMKYEFVLEPFDPSPKVISSLKKHIPMLQI